MLTLLCFLTLAFQQGEITSEPLETTTVSDLFAEAAQKYNSIARNESQSLFERIIAILESKESFEEDDAFIMTESLKYLGVIQFPEETARYFEKLIRFDPAYVLSSKDLPPKIVAVFDDLKAQLVGSLRVSMVDQSQNPMLEDAILFVDGRERGPIFGETVVPMVAGSLNIEIRKNNYQTAQSPIEVKPGVESEYQPLMLRTAAEIVLVTSPPGVKVTFGEQEVGSTENEVPRVYNSRLADMDIEADNAGALVINNVPLGTHRFILEKPCFKPKLLEFNVEELKRITTLPEALEPAGALLTIQTVGESSGLAYLDSERLGFLPIQDYRVCPGEYELKVQFTDGEYIRQLILEDGQEMSVLAEPLPSIAWFGVDLGNQPKPSIEVDQILRGMKTWNIQEVDPTDPGKVTVNPLPALFSGPVMTEENARILTTDVKADLYMAARAVRRKVVINYLEVAFWTPLSKSVQLMYFDYREIGKLDKLLTTLDRFPRMTRPWLGFQTAKLFGLTGCKIIEVHPSGPSADKLQIGDFVQKLNGGVLRKPGELMALIDTTPVQLEINNRQVEIQPIETIAEVPFDLKTAVPQALLAKFDKMAKYHPDSLIRDSAHFNKARLQFFLGDDQQAYDIFSTMKLNADYGINQGTLYYYQGLCFRRLKLPSEATASFNRVLSYPHATLFDAYGPSAAFWARAAIDNP